MKKIIKNPIFMFILGAIIFGSIGVAASQIFAKDIYFEPKEGWTLEENTVEAAIDDLYSKSNEKIIFLSTAWKGYQSWNNDGLSNSLIINSSYLSYSNSVITFLKDCKIKVNVQMKNTNRSSNNPQYDLIYKGNSVLKFSNGTSDEVTSSNSKIIDAKTGDTLYAKMYGGGEPTYYTTWIEIVNEQE